jgi:hypothetical protein
MLLWIRHNLMTPGLVHRGIAIFFLAFTFVDLTLIDLAAPELCNEGLGALGACIANEVVCENNDQAPGMGAEETRPGETSRPEDVTDEDCFCCCAHIVPALRITAPRLNIKAPVSEALTPAISSVPLNSPYHPPRSS